MPVSTYTSHELIGVVESLENPPLAFFRDRYFPAVVMSDKLQVLFDVVDKKRRLAPYVSPLMEGKVMRHLGYDTRAFEPPYVKPKSVIDPNEMFKRLPGEMIGGDLTPEQRRDARVAMTMAEHEEVITGREEIQAAEALRLGQVTVTGEGYGTIVLDFGRAANQTVVLTGGARWSELTSTPLEDLEAWALIVRQNSNAVVRDVILAPDAWQAAKVRIIEDNNLAQLLFDSRRGSTSQAELGPTDAAKIRFEGSIGDFNFWTYSDTYQDADGNDIDVMPSGNVVLASGLIEGTRTYGAIRDVRFLRAARLWPKMYEDHDPSVEYILTQSAPLMVPLRPNASFGAEVLNGGP